MSCWFRERVGAERGRTRRITIVALARKLLVALWRYATQGVIPNLVGRSLSDARLRLKKLKIEPKISWGIGKPGTVLQQKPRAGLAAAPCVKVELVVARGGLAAVAVG